MEGWRPEDAGATTVDVNISGENIGEVRTSGGLFELNLPVDIEAGSRFRLAVSTDNALEAAGDARPLGYVLRSIKLS